MKEAVIKNAEEIKMLLESREQSDTDLYQILDMLKEKELLGGCEQELEQAVLEEIFCVWKMVSEEKMGSEYEGKMDFAEARILEYYRNERKLTKEQAEEVLEYIRAIGSSLTMETLRRLHRGESAAGKEEKDAEKPEESSEEKNAEETGEAAKEENAEITKEVTAEKLPLIFVLAALAAAVVVIFAAVTAIFVAVTAVSRKRKRKNTERYIKTVRTIKKHAKKLMQFILS